MNILIVDDDKDASSSLAQVFTLAGHSAVVANDGERALAAMAVENFDCIILDLVMPKLSGPEMLDALKSKALPPVIVLTGYDPFFGEKLPGVDAVVKKPADPQMLLGLIASLTSRPTTPGTTGGLS